MSYFPLTKFDGQLVKNYIENAEANAGTNGWTRYKTTSANVAPVDFGGSPNANVTWTRNTSSALSNPADFKLTKDAVDRQGEGVYCEFSPESADYASILRTTFKYLSSSAYADGDVRIYLVSSGDSFASDINVIELTPRDLPASLNARLHITEGQADYADTKIRLCIHIASTNASAYTVQFTRISCGQREIARGSVVTDAKDYSPTLTNVTEGTGVFKDFEWHRIGQFMEIIGGITIGTGGSASGVIKIPMPSGYSIDFTAIGSPVSGGGFARVGMADAYDTSTGNNYVGTVFVDNTNNAFYVRGDTSTNDWATAVPFTWAVGDSFTVRIKVPIAGWSSNTNISSDYGSRIIAARYKYSTGTVNHTSSGSYLDLDADLLTGKDYDTTNSYNTSTNTYTAPETGYYNFSGVITFTTNGTGYRQLHALKNGSTYVELCSLNASAYPGSAVMPFTTQVFLKAGDTWKLQAYQNSGGTLTFETGGGATYNCLEIFKIQSPQTLMGSEVVSARYKLNASNANTSIADAGGGEIVDFNVKEWDTHNAVTTGASWKFTAPYSGFYRVSAVVYWASISNFTESQIRLYKNGTTTISTMNASSASPWAIHGTDTVYLLQGEFISVLGFQDSSDSSARNIYTGSDLYTHVAIEKVN